MMPSLTSHIARRLFFGLIVAIASSALVAGLSAQVKPGKPSHRRRSRDRQAGPRSEPADRRGVHEEDQGVHDRDLLPLAARRLPAGLEDRADAEGRARRHRRRAGQAAVLEGGLRLHAPAREVDAAREGLLDRHDRGRARDDRRRGRVRGADGEARREQGRSREARRPAHDQDGRRAGGRDREARRAGLLHHRHDPLDRGGRADGADGAGLPARGRREPVHPQHPRARHHADHAGRRSRRPRPVVDVYKWRKKHPNDTPPNVVYWGHYVAHDNNRDAMGADAEAVAERAEHLPRLEGAGAARPARVGLVPLRQHDRRRALQRVARSDPHQRVAADRLEQRERDDAHGHAGRLRVRHVRHLVAGLPDVHRRDAQRHQPAVRDVRQRRQRRHRGADAVADRDRRAPGSGRTRRSPRVRWSLRNNNNYEQTGHPRLAQLLRQQPRLLPAELLRQEQALDPEGEGRRAGGVRAAGERSAARARRPSCCACCRSRRSRSRARPRRSR